MTDETNEKPKRGFAAMSAEQRQEVARKGGGSVKPENRAFARDPAHAARAGRIGGAISRGGGRKPNPPAA